MGIAHVALGPTTSMGRRNSNAERSAASTELAASHKADLANRPTSASRARRRTYASAASSACALAIAGISGVGEKPSSASARTARASTRQPVD